MTAALHRAAKTRIRVRPPLRSGTHASRWADDVLPPRARRSPRLRSERRARRSPPGRRTRVGPLCLYGYDAHGNVAFLTDATGSETDTYTYDAWGNLVGRTGSTFSTRLFVGEELDPDLGLINLRNRYYNEEQGRFLTVDTFDGGRSRSPLSSNRYLYAEADPSNKKDPQGLLAGPEYAIGLTTAQTLAVVVAIGGGAAVGVPSDVAVGEKNSCEFQEVADEFAAQAKEPVVSINPKCPLIQCFCHATVYDMTSFVKPREQWEPGVPKKLHANDYGRSRAAAAIRCTNALEDRIGSHPANSGWYEGTLELGDVEIDHCRTVSP